MPQPKEINNDPFGLMKDKYPSTDKNNTVPVCGVGVFMHGIVTSDIEIIPENKFMFTLKIASGKEFLIIADSCKCDMTKPIRYKHVMLSNETKRQYEKPRIKFSGKSFGVRFYTKSFSTIELK